jgi:prepilin-type processing-associated H-X9-DG protein
MVALENWKEKTAITHAYHMGCYASLPAVRIAHALVQSEKVENPSFLVDIVHNEMCSLHMNPSSHSPEQMVVQTLFADGHVKYSLSVTPEENNLKV